MESSSRTSGRDQQSDHRHEMKSRYSEPENDSPYQYSQQAINQAKDSRYQKVPSPSKENQRFPESGVNRDQRGLPGSPDRSQQSSDARIREIISDELIDNPTIDARDINVIVRDGEVRLVGTVDSERSKRNAEHVVSRMPGVRHADNELKVRPTSEDQ
jgi:osmotically-inducible protein OsmY